MKQGTQSKETKDTYFNTNETTNKPTTTTKTCIFELGLSLPQSTETEKVILKTCVSADKTCETKDNIDIVIEVGCSCYLYSSSQAIPSLQVLRMQ